MNGLQREPLRKRIFVSTSHYSPAERLFNLRACYPYPLSEAIVQVLPDNHLSEHGLGSLRLAITAASPHAAA